MRTKQILTFLVTMATTMIIASLTTSASSYVVKSGDTLGKISSMYNVSIEDIALLNNISNVNKIAVGQTLFFNEGNSIYDLFDAEYYAAVYPDVVEEYGTEKSNLYKHFIQYGANEARTITPQFNVLAYKSAYPDLTITYGNNLLAYYQHYLTYGQAENRTLITLDACAAAGINVINEYIPTTEAEKTKIATPTGITYENNILSVTSTGNELNKFYEYYIFHTTENISGGITSTLKNDNNFWNTSYINHTYFGRNNEETSTTFTYDMSKTGYYFVKVMAHSTIDSEYSSEWSDITIIVVN